MKQSKTITSRSLVDLDEAITEAEKEGWTPIKCGIHYVPQLHCFEHYALMEKGEGAPSIDYSLDLIQRLREKSSTYNRDLLDEAADTIEWLLEELADLRCCNNCKHFHDSIFSEPCSGCYEWDKWEHPGGES